MVSRAEIIAQAKRELGTLANSLSDLDTTSGDFHYPLNNALAMMEKGDADVSAFTMNEVRIAVLGTKYEVLKSLQYRYPMHAVKNGRRQFSNIGELIKAAKVAFMAALSGADTPPTEIPAYAEDVAVWGPSHKKPFSQTEKVGIDEFGDDTTDEYES